MSHLPFSPPASHLPLLVASDCHLGSGPSLCADLVPPWLNQAALVAKPQLVDCPCHPRLPFLCLDSVPAPSVTPEPVVSATAYGFLSPPPLLALTVFCLPCPHHRCLTGFSTLPLAGSLMAPLHQPVFRHCHRHAHSAVAPWPNRFLNTIAGSAAHSASIPPPLPDPSIVP